MRVVLTYMALFVYQQNSLLLESSLTPAISSKAEDIETGDPHSSLTLGRDTEWGTIIKLMIPAVTFRGIGEGI